MIPFKSVCAAVLGLAPLALCAQTADELRGAWITDLDGARHVLYLVFRDDTISGMKCHDCTDPDKLAFVDDGTLDADGLHFNLYHSPAPDASYTEEVDAMLVNSELLLTLRQPQGDATNIVMRRAPPQEVPPPIADARPNSPPAGQPRMLPAAAGLVTEDKVLGLWLWGTGPTKQYFIFKRHKDGVRGMVCGPCDSARDFAPLEKVILDGTTFHFEIVHEDNGIGYEEHGPFSNVADALISMNEMQMTAWASFDPDGRKFEMTLLGPMRYMPPTTP